MKIYSIISFKNFFNIEFIHSKYFKHLPHKISQTKKAPDWKLSATKTELFSLLKPEEQRVMRNADKLAILQKLPVDFDEKKEIV